MITIATELIQNMIATMFINFEPVQSKQQPTAQSLHPRQTPLQNKFVAGLVLE
jgi:hypothetical protein